MNEKFSSHYDVVGSFLRPSKLKHAKEDLANGKIDQDNYDEILKKEIKRVVEKQAKLGLKDATDGEFGRSWWHLDFLWASRVSNAMIIAKVINSTGKRPELTMLSWVAVSNIIQTTPSLNNLSI